MLLVKSKNCNCHQPEQLKMEGLQGRSHFRHEPALDTDYLYLSSISDGHPLHQPVQRKRAL
jgi:hypothetical protein